MKALVAASSWAYGLGPSVTALAAAESLTVAGADVQLVGPPGIVNLARGAGIASVVEYPDSALPVYPGEEVTTLHDVVECSSMRSRRFVQSIYSFLSSALSAWQPAIVFHDYELLLPIAARLSDVSPIVVSPVTWPDHPDFGTHALSSTRVIENIKHEVAGFSALECMQASDILFRLSDYLVCPAYEVMDPMIRQSVDAYVGHLGCDTIERGEDHGTLAWLENQTGVRIVGYLGDSNLDLGEFLRGLETVLSDERMLIAVGAEGLRSIQSSDSRVAERARYVESLPLSRGLDIADVFLSHGGRNSVANALRHGVRVVAAGSGDPERDYFARNIVQAGYGEHIRTKEASDAQCVIESLRRCADRFDPSALEPTHNGASVLASMISTWAS